MELCLEKTKMEFFSDAWNAKMKLRLLYSYMMDLLEVISQEILQHIRYWEMGITGRLYSRMPMIMLGNVILVKGAVEDKQRKHDH